jgi:hypothetical protein
MKTLSSTNQEAFKVLTEALTDYTAEGSWWDGDPEIEADCQKMVAEMETAYEQFCETLDLQYLKRVSDIDYMLVGWRIDVEVQ